MQMRLWKNGLMALGFGTTVLVSASTQAQDPIDALDNVQETGRAIFKLVDENNDGQISQKEAVDAGNLVVGGFFFRADTNGDGVVSQAEAQAARESFLTQRPWVRFLIGRVEASKPETGVNGTANPANMIMGLLDSNGDKNLQATEVRQAIQTTVQGLFAAADTNRDGLMSPVEVNAAIAGAVKAAEQATFQAADLNHDGNISKEEFTKALTDPTNAVFMVLDANNDGQLSPQELQSAGRVIEAQIRRTILPESPNSLKNLIQTGRKPEQVAPVPNLSVPGRTSANPTAAPAGTVPATTTNPPQQ